MNEYDFTQTINDTQLQDEIATAGLPAPSMINTEGTSVQIFYSNALTSGQQTTLASVVSAHVANPAYVTVAMQAQITQLTGYLNNVNPLVANTARAAMVAKMAPRLPIDLLTAINAAIQAQVGF